MAEQNKQDQPNTPPAAASPAAENDSLDAPAAADTATPAAAPTAVAPAKPADKKPAALNFPADTAAENVKSSINIYFIIFIVIILGALGLIYYTVSTAHKVAKTTTTKAPSLTSEQLATLKGNTTLVGDSKQTLDIQSNSVFENQVFVRQDVSVAGGLTVGKSLSLPSISVGGAGTFGSLQIGNDINVKGNSVLQGTVTIQKNLTVSGTASFGGLAVGALSATSLQLNGDLTVTRHLITNGTAINMTRGNALGGNGTVSVGGTDTAGTITINTGSSPGIGTFVTVTFGKAFDSVPRVIVSPIGVSAATVTYYVNRTPTGFSLGCATAPPAGASFAFDYFVVN